jgi:N-acetylneuraminic acid mutarotase
MQKADFGGGDRYHAIAFSIGNYAYAGTGTTSASDMDDMWRFDPTANTWTPIAPCPGGVRSGAVAFTINNLGYVALGDFQNDVEEYHPQTNTWQTKAPSPVSGYSSCAAVWNNKAYVGVGSGTSWAEFNPATNSWMMKATFPGAYRLGSGCFAYNGWVYIVSGTDWSQEFPDAFAYNPSTDQWVQVSNFPGQARHYFTCFAIGSRIYGGTGTSGTNYHDWWEYGELNGIDSHTQENGIRVFPNPVIDKAEFDFENSLTSQAIFTLYDLQGKKVRESIIEPSAFWMFNREDLDAGIYSYSIISENKNVSTASNEIIGRGKLVIQ